MAYIPLSNGGALPVFATDVLDGPLNNSANPSQYPQTFVAAPTGDAPVPTTNFAGPKYDFFRIAFTGNNIAQSAGVAQALQLLLQTIQNGGVGAGSPGIWCGGSTVAMYSATQAGTTPADDSVVSIAVYPTGAFNTQTPANDNSSTNLEAIINALGTPTFQDGTTFDFTTAGGMAVTQPGFVLA